MRPESSCRTIAGRADYVLARESVQQFRTSDFCHELLHPITLLLERLAGEPHTRLRYFCSPQHTDSALYPIIGQMERAAGRAHDDTLQARLDKLDTLLAQTSTSIGDA